MKGWPGLAVLHWTRGSSAKVCLIFCKGQHSHVSAIGNMGAGLGEAEAGRSLSLGVWSQLWAGSGALVPCRWKKAHRTFSKQWPAPAHPTPEAPQSSASCGCAETVHTGTTPPSHRGASRHSILHLPLSFSGLSVTASEPSGASAVTAQYSMTAQSILCLPGKTH